MNIYCKITKYTSKINLKIIFKSKLMKFKNLLIFKTKQKKFMKNYKLNLFFIF